MSIVLADTTGECCVEGMMSWMGGWGILFWFLIFFLFVFLIVVVIRELSQPRSSSTEEDLKREIRELKEEIRKLKKEED